MDELINLFPTNSPVHSVFLLVDASIVRLVKENTEVGAVDEVVRPVINQNITHHHLFVVSDDDVVCVQEREQLQDTLDFHTTSAVVGCRNHIELVAFIVKPLQILLCSRHGCELCPHLIFLEHAVNLLLCQCWKCLRDIPIGYVLNRSCGAIPFVQGLDPALQECFGHIVRIEQYSQTGHVHISSK